MKVLSLPSRAQEELDALVGEDRPILPASILPQEMKLLSGRRERALEALEAKVQRALVPTETHDRLLRGRPRPIIADEGRRNRGVPPTGIAQAAI